jgi:serine/threonine protein phosphatase PrpC
MGRIVADAPSDTFQKRISLFLDEAIADRGTNGTSEFSLGTTVGPTRKQNQDRALIIQAEYSQAPERNFLLGVVADGMGGLSDGDKAAAIAISVFAAGVVRASKQPIVHRLRQAAFAANEAVFRMLRGRGGTTLSAMLVSRDSRAVGLNVGDSRVYGISKYHDLKQLSRDDTLGRVLGTRHVDPSQKDKLVQFVGIGEGLEPHIVSAEGTTFSSLLISTDGIHGVMPGGIEQLVRPQVSKLELVRRLLSFGDLMSSDNGTAMVMPIQLGASNASSSAGIELKLWSPFDKLEIWIPSIADEVRSPAVADQQQAGFISPLQNIPDETVKQSTVRKQKRKVISGKRSAERKKKKRVSDQGEAWLPIEDVETPSIDISFPERRRR